MRFVANLAVAFLDHPEYIYIQTVMRVGNDVIHVLTSSKRQSLRVELGDFEGNYRFAEFDNFKLASASSRYTLTSIGKYRGNVGQ